MLRNFIAALVAALSLGACAVMPDGRAGRASVENAAEQLRLLMIDPDKARLEAIVSDGLSYGHSGGKVDTKQSFIADLMSGASDFVTLSITQQTVGYADGVALVRHNLSAATNDGGKPGTVSLRVLQVWAYADGRWRLVARQAIRPPQ